MKNQQHEKFDREQGRRLALLEQENRAIAAAGVMSQWQIKTSYYLAMLNNKALQNGREKIALVLIPGNPPKIRQAISIRKNGKRPQ